MDSNPFRSNDDGVPRWASPWGAPWASVPRHRHHATHHVTRQAAAVPVARVRRSKSWRVTPRRVLATSAALSFVGAVLVITLSMI